jgi:L-ascorbate metabolism protein UlaG (beta-lactamase superfamily)
MKMRVTSLRLLGGLAGASLAVATMAAEPAPAEKNLAVEKTAGGDLVIQPLNHAALRFEYRGKQYYVDPAGRADWSSLPKADAIFVTHEHGDHLSPPTIALLKKEGTLIFANEASVKQAGFGTVIAVGEKKEVLDITVEAVPAYNLNPARQQFHPKARKDNGYILTFGGKRVYVAGDTEVTPEMKALQDIAIAFVPISLPNASQSNEVAEAARAFKPKILYPYHQGKSDPAEVKRLLADVPEIEVRVLALP